VRTNANYALADDNNHGNLNLRQFPAKTNSKKQGFVKLCLADGKPLRQNLKLPTKSPPRKAATTSVPISNSDIGLKLIGNFVQGIDASEPKPIGITLVGSSSKYSSTSS
jgi:hypothetical protein